MYPKVNVRYSPITHTHSHTHYTKHGGAHARVSVSECSCVLSTPYFARILTSMWKLICDKKNWGFHFTQKKSTIVNFYNNKIIDGNMHPFIMRNKQFTRAHFHVFVERENRNEENENNLDKDDSLFTHIHTHYKNAQIDALIFG